MSIGSYASIVPKVAAVLEREDRWDECQGAEPEKTQNHTDCAETSAQECKQGNRYESLEDREENQGLLLVRSEIAAHRETHLLQNDGGE